MRTFDDIIPPSRRPAGGQVVPPPSPLPPQLPQQRPVPPPSRNSFPYVIALIALIIIAVAAALLFYFSGAKIEVTPSTASVTVQSSFTAGPADDLPFTLVTAKKTATASVPSSGTKQSDTPASGSITIYNSQVKAQTLIANTRFATQAGLIFRIHKSVTIPGGSSEKPGSVVATVYADKPGSMYDVGPTSFTVPGLAGTPEASAVYARSTSAMTGGASGTVPVVDPTAEAEAVASLESSMGSDLVSTLSVPQGYVLLPGAATTTFEELAPTASDTAGQASIVVEADTVGVAFPESAFVEAIAVASASSSNGGTLGQGTSLTLTPTSAFPATSSDTFSFSLAGNAVIVSQVNPSTIATAVAGKTREQARVALANYPEVKRAVLVLRPFWRSTFPEDPSAITVTTLAPAAP